MGLTSLRKFIVAVAAVCLLPTTADPQSSPGFVPGQTLPAAQLDSAFTNKQDYPVTTQPCVTNNTTAATTAFVHNCGTGSVTSVAATVPTGLAISGSPITTTGTLGITWSGTIPAAQLPFPSASTLGGVESATAGTNQFMTGINTGGVPQFAQPSFSNLSGVASNAQIPTPTPSALGGVESASGGANQFMIGINTSGVPLFAQPSFSSLTGNIAVSQMNNGTGASSSTFWNGAGQWVTAPGGGNVSTSGTITSGRCAQWNASTTVVSTSNPCGSVTSVAATVPTGLAISGSPITTSGTLALTWSGTIPNAQIPTPGASVLGGIESITCGAGQFLNVISASGVPSCSTPAGGGNVSTSGTITSGNCAQWNSTTTLVSTTGPCGGGGNGAFNDYANIKTYGATGDGTCHALSGTYANLAAAQAVYPFVSDLTQCIDWAATQQAINVAYNTAPAGLFAPGSFPVYCPTGAYELSNPILFDVPNNSAGTYSAWASGTTYGNAANVKYNGLPWISMGSGNVGNPPTAYDTFPAQMQIVTGGNTPAGFPWASVQISNASPAVITPLLGGGTLTVVANQPIVFFTQQYANPNGGSTPSLPTGLNANQVYYVVGSSITSTTFEVSTTPGGSAINTSSAGVGNFFISGQVWQIAPVQAAATISNHVSFIGAAGIAGSSGCQFATQFNWTSPAVMIGPQQGMLVENIYLQGSQSASPGANGYRCATLANINQSSGQGNAGFELGSIGWANLTSLGASRTKYVNVGAGGFYIADWRGFGGSGELGDQNTWEKINYSGNCIGVYMGSTQTYINTIYEATMANNGTNVVAYTQEGVDIKGGIYSTAGLYLGTSFSISSVSVASGCGFLCVTATVASPDNNLQSPMCAYSAGQANNSGATWLNSWYLASGCGYNTFIIITAQWGAVGMYVENYNPFTGVITLGIPAAYAGIYEGTCCGSNLTTELQAATTLWAAESTTTFFGDIQAENVHVENDGVSTTLSCWCTSFFGGARPAEMKNIFFNTEASLGSVACCNKTVTGHSQSVYTAGFYAQQVIPFINSQMGDTVIDRLVGGNNSLGDNSNAPDMDRVLLANATSTYIEGRHTTGANFTGSDGVVVSSGSGGNASSPLYDFYPTSLGGGFSSTVPLVNPSTIGQLSCGYYAMCGGAYGSGTWDNGTVFGPYSQFSHTSAGAYTDMANVWRTRGWGQAPQWGVRPAPWASPCILPSQVTSLGSLPTITFTMSLRDYLVVVNGGTSGTYAVNDVLTLVGGSFTTAGQVKVTSVSGGQVTGVQLLVDGSYIAPPAANAAFTVTGGGGTGATFQSTGPIWYVTYTIGYPMLWGGTMYKVCDFQGSSQTHNLYMSKNTGYSYFQNLTTTNVPHLSWTMDGASPFVYMNYEALQLMFPGLVISLADATHCAGGGTQSFMVLEVHPTLGYVKVVRADTDGSGYVPSLASSGTTCSGTTIGQQSTNLANPAN